MKNISLIVPFYKNSHLVSSVTESLISCTNELNLFNIQVFYYNDSPDFEDLNIVFDTIYQLYDIKFSLNIIKNSENLGFVKTVNQAFNQAILDNTDIILLNSDTRIYPGAISELCTVAYLDYMTGFVSPRSNNATICTYPHGSDSLNLSPDQFFKNFKKSASFLPRFSYVPTAVGFCLYIKNFIIKEFGGFDLIYGKGYNEENDLILRANRKGYKAVLANHAFVYHEGEQSFNHASESKKILEKRNHEILLSRYPEYLTLIHRYFNSARYLAEASLSKISLSNNNETNIAFDFSSFAANYNGTYEAGKAILTAASKSWPSNIKIFVIVNSSVWNFHCYEEIKGITRIEPGDYSFNISAVVRIGQTFSPGSIEQLIYTAPVVCVNMLDTIAADCGNLSQNLDEVIWHFTMKWSNIIYTISKFSEKQLLSRFNIENTKKVFPILLSTNPKDYYYSPVETPKIINNTVLIIGNHYEHKGLLGCTELLARELSNINFIILGTIPVNLPNVIQISSGSLTDDEIKELYQSVDCMIYPSYYEGFGFPVMHALAHNKPLFLRNIPVFKEISDTITQGTENLIWFETNSELINILKAGLPQWKGKKAEGDFNGWNRVANQTLDVVTAELKNVNFNLIEDRFRWFNLIFKPNNYNQQIIYADSHDTIVFRQKKQKLRTIIGKFLPNFVITRLVKLIKLLIK